REENGGATPFNLPEDGIRRFNTLKNVFLSGHENFVGSLHTDTLFQLADWASKAFGLTNAESFIDEDGVEHTSRRPIVIVDQTGLDNLKATNPAFAESLEKGLGLTDIQAFKVWIPKEHGSNAPYVILVNEDYVYLDNKGRPFTIKHGSTTKSPSVITAFSHELGHIVFEKWKNNMPKALKAKLWQEYQKAVPKSKRGNYPVEEWMADQFAIYGSRLAKDGGETTGAPPAWKKLFANLKKLWDQTGLLIRQVLGRAGGPSETYHQYLSKIGRAFASREAARNWYYQQVAKGVAPIDAARAARTHLEKRYAKDGVIDPALQLKDVVRLRTVPAEDSTAAAVEGAAQAADQA
ncbi:MAG: hypothetical protein GY905_12870, partial [Gammaproteobacteria bacterium]|nr:hypothetical protein [Gammaproteobacteria bacterium]